MRSPIHRLWPFAVVGLVLLCVSGLGLSHLFPSSAQARPQDHWKREMPVPRFKPLVADKPGSESATNVPPPKPRPSYIVPSFLPTRSILPPKPKALSDEDVKNAKSIDAYFGKDGRSLPILIEVDKPIYKPGETIWLRVVQIHAQGERPLRVASGLDVEFVDPRGAVQRTMKVQSNLGHAALQIDLAEGMVGGEYTIRAKNFILGGGTFEKKVTISVYQAPRIKKKLDFIRKAYGAGDLVQATLALHRATGAPLQKQVIQGVASLDGKEFKRFSTTTDDKGEALLEVKLPASLQTDDGLLTAMISEGGITESISRPIPLVVQRLKVGFFPEGGKAAIGLSSRVYFSVRRAIDEKPFDIEGVIKNKKGRVITTVRSFHDGMGRFTYTPRAKQTYTLEITKPEGIQATFSLPQAEATGLSMQLTDDFLSTSSDIHLLLLSDREQSVAVTALQQETLLHQSRVTLHPGKNLLRLPLKDQRRGILTLTVWNDEGQPMAERLVFRHRDRGLKFEIVADKKRYEPRQTAHVKVRVTDADGKPVSNALVGVAVVDDTVLSYADDEEPNFLAQRYLTTQLTGQIHKPNFYFDRKKPKAYEALDLVMGTHGWRDFQWTTIQAGAPPAPLKSVAVWQQELHRHYYGRYNQPVETTAMRRRPMQPMPMPPPSPAPDMKRAEGRRPGRVALAKPSPKRVLVRNKRIVIRPANPDDRAQVRPARDPKPMPLRAERAEKKREMAAEAQKDVVAGKAAPRRWRRGRRAADEIAPDPEPRAPIAIARRAPAQPYPYYRRPYYGSYIQWHYTRQFPTVFYPDKAPVQTRTDFRETIYWSPQIATDPWGEAKITFGLNDSVTSFRVRVSAVAAEGGLGSHHDQIASARPFFVVAKLPLEVSAKDAIALPLTLRNDSERDLELRIKSHVSPEFKLLEDPLPGVLKLAVGQAKTFFYPIRVLAQRGHATVSFDAVSEGLSDSIQQTIAVFPRGFPRALAFSGLVSAKEPKSIVFTMPKDIQEAAPTGEVQIYPNPLSSVLQGMEAMLQEPSGCFEQTSSSNYPNVMVMQYLKEHRIASPSLTQRAGQLLDRGYQRLVGYETKTRGYEWFGGSPGHEALTAYGIMQFVAMKEIYPKVSQAMIQRTSDWLLSRRDGKGGFQRNSRALDTFGQAKKEITDAYITFALSEGGRKDLNKELRWVEDAAYGSKDPYYLALVVNSILNVRGTQDKIGQSLLQKLLGLQHKDGGLRGAEHSITMSSGQSLHIETTALSILAMLKGKAPFGSTLKAARWLQGQRSTYGGFGATQSTILALKALIAFERANRKPSSSGTYRVLLRGKVVDKGSFSTSQTEPILLRGFLAHFRPGKNTLRLEISTPSEVPYNLGLRYTTQEPLSDADVAVSLQTSLDRTKAKMGETVRLSAVIANATDKGIPMVVARIAFPGAFEAQLWQLKQMREQGLVDFYETQPREVIVYYRSMAPNAKKVLHFDLNARVTGNYVGSASSAYLYYTHEKKVYTAPLVSRISP